MEPVARARKEDSLTEYLRVLGVPNRVALLRALQVPKAIGEIQVPTSRRSAAGSVGRVMTRQGLQRHLAALNQLGLVITRAGERNGRAVTEYVVNHARLFVVAEELGRLAAIRPVLGTTPRTAARETAAARLPPPPPDGPAFVLANGPIAGTPFALRGDGPWIVGRDEDAAVSLRYDPFVSRIHAHIVRDRDRYLVRAEPTARSATRVNWHDVEAGRPVPLQAGDALGVGRSLLFFRGT